MAVDAISLEVFKNLFASIAEEMGLALQRASFSPNIRERLDFSCAIFDAQGRMVAQAAHIPVHLGSMPASVMSALQAMEDINRGDVIVLNNPYQGGTHLPDITMVSPVFDGDGVVFYVASRAHHADVGGMSPGSLPLSTELYQEGIIIPPVKLKLSGWLNEDILHLIVANSRAPQERMGDIEAQLSAHRIGEMRLVDVLVRYGRNNALEHAQALQDYATRMTLHVIRNIPNGTYSYTDYLEGDGQTNVQLPISVTLTVEDDSVHADFSGSAPQTLGNVNAVPAIVRSATWYCIRLLADEHVPVNHGSFLPVSVSIPDECLLNPRFPAAVAVGNTETSQRIVDVVLGALAQALPQRIPAASQGTMNNVTIGGVYEDHAFVYYETIAGGHGASPQGAGLSGRHSHMTNTMNTPVEALEMAYPLRVRRYALRPASGGAGKYQGGQGIIREYEFLTSATLTVNAERRQNVPYGLQGGKSASAGENQLIREGQKPQIMPAKFTTQVEIGDRLIIATPGGGGWG
jgi:N-methylhydantoinase B